MLQNGSFNASYTPNNQMFGYAYDPSGNLLSDGMNAMTWDAENRISGVGGATYLYEAEGDRVETRGIGVTDTIYFGGRPVARLSGGQRTDLIYGPTGLLAEVPGTQTGAPMYRLTDHLGANIGSLQADGTFINPLDSNPFGKTISGNTTDPYRFTGKERDAESGNDYFGARYYASGMGRFMSPDAGKINSKHLMNPQKWNKYAYVLNNPLSLVDPDGMEEMWIQYRAFIPQSNVGFIGKGDGRSFSTQENASSRVSVTMHIETDPAKNGGNPLLGVTQGVNTTHNNLTGNDTPAVVVQAPTVTATQDANGNVDLNVQMNVHSGDLPGADSIRSNVDIGVNEAGTQGSVQGTVSGSPAFEANFAPQGGPTTNLPVQGASSNAATFTRGLTQTNTVDKKTEIKQPGQQ